MVHGIVPDWQVKIRLVVSHKGVLVCDKRCGDTVVTLTLVV